MGEMERQHADNRRLTPSQAERSADRPGRLFSTFGAQNNIRRQAQAETDGENQGTEGGEGENDSTQMLLLCSVDGFTADTHEGSLEAGLIQTQIQPR